MIAGVRELDDARASFFAGHGDVVNGAIIVTAGAAVQQRVLGNFATSRAA